MKSIWIYNASRESYITKNAHRADKFWRRLIGLMWRGSVPMDYGFAIKPCRQVHTMNMKFTIDVVYLNKAGVVIAVDYEFEPWRFGKNIKDSYEVIEFQTGFVGSQLTVGDVIVIENVE